MAHTHTQSLRTHKHHLYGSPSGCVGMETEGPVAAHPHTRPNTTAHTHSKHTTTTLHTHTHTCTHAHTHTRTHAHTHTSTHAHKHTHTQSDSSTKLCDTVMIADRY